MNQSLDYYRQAHRIAFGPLLFQAVRVARDRGLLEALKKAGPTGASPAEAAAACGLSLYAARVLLEGCDGAGAVEEEEGRYRLSPVGVLLLGNELVRVNMDFTHDVCYQGAFFLDEALELGRPAGLKVFGPWDTIYQGLMELPARARKSWLDFDHSYSDAAFPAALAAVFSRPVARLLDVGGNTGKWSLLCLETQPDLQVTLLDHASQAKAAADKAAQAGLSDRLRTVPLDLLDHSQAFPGGFDVVWMSQFLDCFGEADIIELLKRGRAALAPSGSLMVLETCWDRQPNAAARDAVMATSLYFTCMANGDSRMLHSQDLARCFAAAGLKLETREQLGFHTLFTCAAA
jgi:SAM-dependent methyltransferase